MSTGFTIIIHPYKKYRTTNNILCLWFISLVKWDVLAHLKKGTKICEELLKINRELKQDYKIVQDLANNQIGNGIKTRSNKRKSNKRIRKTL